MTFVFHRPTTIGESCELDRRYAADTCFIAGGTDLAIQIARRQRQPTHLIDLSLLPGLSYITLQGQDDCFEIGALTTHKAIELATQLGHQSQALKEAARLIGGHQVRNIGTIGGNIANASPAADLVPALLVHDAEVVLFDGSRNRAVMLENFLIGPRQTGRRPGEMIVSIRLRVPTDSSATAFLKAGRRKAMEIAIVNTAARLTVDSGGRCKDVRIAIGSAGATAIRARRAEKLLLGEEVLAATLEACGQAAAGECMPISDVRASAEYRRLLVSALVTRALQTCVARIRLAEPGFRADFPAITSSATWAGQAKITR